MSLYCAPLAKQSMGSLNWDCPCGLMTMYHCTGQTSYMGHSTLPLWNHTCKDRGNTTGPELCGFSARRLYLEHWLTPGLRSCKRFVVSWMYFSTFQMDAYCCNFSFLYSRSGLIPQQHLLTFIYGLLLTSRPKTQPAAFRAKCQAGCLQK